MTREEFIAIDNRLRPFIREHLNGRCRQLSQGDRCECPLCDLDRLLMAIPVVHGPAPQPRAPLEKLTTDELVNRHRGNREMLKQMIGNLYLSVVLSENERIESILKERGWRQLLGR